MFIADIERHYDCTAHFLYINIFYGFMDAQLPKYLNSHLRRRWKLLYFYQIIKLDIVKLKPENKIKHVDETAGLSELMYLFYVKMNEGGL